MWDRSWERYAEEREKFAYDICKAYKFKVQIWKIDISGAVDIKGHIK